MVPPQHDKMGRQTIDSDIAQSRGAIVLHVCVGRVEQADKHGNGTRINQLLPVFIWKMTHERSSMA